MLNDIERGRLLNAMHADCRQAMFFIRSAKGLASMLGVTDDAYDDVSFLTKAEKAVKRVADGIVTTEATKAPTPEIRSRLPF